MSIYAIETQSQNGWVLDGLQDGLVEVFTKPERIRQTLNTFRQMEPDREYRIVELDSTPIVQEAYNDKYHRQVQLPF